MTPPPPPLLKWFIVLGCTGREGEGRKAVVILYDIPPESDVLRNVRLEDLRRRQPSLFENAGVVTMCGQLSKDTEMRKADWDELANYLISELGLNTSTTSELEEDDDDVTALVSSYQAGLICENGK